MQVFHTRLLPVNHAVLVWYWLATLEVAFFHSFSFIGAVFLGGDRGFLTIFSLEGE